ARTGARRPPPRSRCCAPPCPASPTSRPPRGSAPRRASLLAAQALRERPERGPARVGLGRRAVAVTLVEVGPAGGGETRAGLAAEDRRRQRLGHRVARPAGHVQHVALQVLGVEVLVVRRIASTPGGLVLAGVDPDVGAGLLEAPPARPDEVGVHAEPEEAPAR